MKKPKEIITEDKIMDVLNEKYGKTLQGIPKVTKSVDSLASD